MADGLAPTKGEKSEKTDTQLIPDDLPGLDDIDDLPESTEPSLEIPGAGDADALLNDLMPSDAAELEPIGNENLSSTVSPPGIETDVDLMEEDSGNLDLPPIGNEGDAGNANEALNLNSDLSNTIPKPMNTRTGNAGLGNGVLDMNTIKNIKVNVQAVLGGVSMSVSKLSNLKEGELVSLEKNIGEEIEILANGQLIAHGEIVVIEGEAPKFGITLTSIVGSGLQK